MGAHADVMTCAKELQAVASPGIAQVVQQREPSKMLHAHFNWKFLYRHRVRLADTLKALQMSSAPVLQDMHQSLNMVFCEIASSAYNMSFHLVSGAALEAFKAARNGLPGGHLPAQLLPTAAAAATDATAGRSTHAGSL